MCNSATAKAISHLVGTDGLPIFPANVALRILGEPVVINDAMAGLTASAISVIAAAWKPAYAVRQSEVRVTVLVERWADQLLTGVIVSQLADGTLADPKAAVSLQQQA